MLLVRPFISYLMPVVSSLLRKGSINPFIYASRFVFVSFSLWAMSVYVSRLVYLSDRSSSSDFIAYRPRRWASGA